VSPKKQHFLCRAEKYVINHGLPLSVRQIDEGHVKFFDTRFRRIAALRAPGPSTCRYDNHFGQNTFTRVETDPLLGSRPSKLNDRNG